MNVSGNVYLFYQTPVENGPRFLARVEELKS